MSEEKVKSFPDDKVKLIGFDEGKRAILDHVPGWFGEACGHGHILKVKRQGFPKNEGWCLEVKTPTKTDYCRIGDVIKCHVNGALFVRHFSQQTGEPE